MIFEKRIRQSLMILVLGLGACGIVDSETEQSEYAHMVGDLMSGFSDGLVAGGFSALVAKRPVDRSNTVARSILNGSVFQSSQPLSANCSSVALSACATGSGNGIQTRSFSNCGYGGFTFNGDITYKHSGADCVMNPTESVARTPNYTVTGRRGYTLYVYGAAPAQTITRSAVNTYTFSSNEITRSFTDTTGTAVLEFTSKTTTAVTATHNTTTGERTVTGGVIVVNDLTNAETCTFTPTNVKWDSSCSCPVSGFWEASCSGGSAKIKFDGCGAADFTYGDSSTTVGLDHCF
jgi:hypothetical protein